MPQLITALDGDEQSVSCPCLFNPRERACDTHGIGGWMGTTASQNIGSVVCDGGGTQCIAVHMELEIWCC
jgi:hypothetical protein